MIEETWEIKIQISSNSFNVKERYIEIAENPIAYMIFEVLANMLTLYGCLFYRLKREDWKEEK